MQSYIKMTKTQKAVILLFTLLMVGALIVWQSHSPVKVLLSAEQRNEIWSSEIKMSIFSDNTYIVNLQHQNEHDSLVKRKIVGNYSLKKDTLYFRGGMDSLGIRKAIIKNNLIEFPENDIEGMPIVETILKLKPAIDLKKYPDFTIYTFKPGYDPYFGPDAKPYDLQEKDMVKLFKVLKTCPKDDCQPKGRDYVKKCYASINHLGDKEVVVTFALKPEVPSKKGEYCFHAVLINLDSLECQPVVCFGA